MGEPDTQPSGASTDPEQDDGDTSDVVEGEVGSASLKEPTEAEGSAADLDRLPALGDR
jgi:hypothetical protein